MTRHYIVPFREHAARAQRRSKIWADAVTQTIESNAWTRPSRAVAELEENLAAFCGTRYAVATASGTAALILVLLALELEPASEVIVPAHTFIATAAVPQLLGLSVRLADVDATDYLISPSTLAAVGGERTRVVLPVHLYGRVADVPALRAVFATQGAVVVEEACQAVGARLQGRPAGSLGSAAVFSFGREKAVASIGEGGAVVTNDDALAERLRRYCNQGASGGDYNAVGLNLRIDPLQASVIRAEIADADAILRHRRSVADAYTSAFAGLGIVRNPVVAAGDEHGWYLYVIEVPQRDTFRRHMARRGVETKVHYERPVHLWSAHANLASPGELPIAERLCSSVVSLPLNEYLTDHQIRHVQTAVQEAVAVSQSHE